MGNEILLDDDENDFIEDGLRSGKQDGREKQRSEPPEHEEQPDRNGICYVTLFDPPNKPGKSGSRP
jgi:hypothetical protein